MYSIIKTPARCDPFAEPRNTTEQFQVFSEVLTIGSRRITIIDQYVGSTVRHRLYQPVRWCALGAMLRDARIDILS